MKKILVSSLMLNATLFAGESVYNIGRVDVVGTTNISRNQTLESIDSEAIKDTNSKNVVEALTTLPGVFLQKSGRKNQTDIRIHGFNSRRIAIYVDGIPVYTPYNKDIDLARYLTYNVAEISVSTGYVSPMFGPNTLGGAVNIVTKKPTKKFEGKIGAGVFSGNGREEHATLGTKQNLFYGLFSVSNYQRDYFTISKKFHGAGMEDGGRRDNSDSKDRQLNLKVGFTPNDTDDYSFNYIEQRAKKGNPFYASNYKGGYEGSSIGFRTRKWRWPKWDETSYYFISKTALGRHLLKTRLYYNKFYNKLINYKDPDLTKEKWTSLYNDYSVGGNVEMDFKINKKQILKVSLMQKNDYHTSSFSKDKQDIHANEETQSIGLEHAWKLNNKLRWILGATYDRNKVLKAEYRKGPNIGEYDKYSSESISPQTVLYYKYSDKTKFYGALGERNNMPSLDQRYSTRFGDAKPNPNLKSEKSMNYELGLEHMINDRHMIKASVYYSSLKDAIENVTLTSGKIQSQNIGKEEHKGVDISIDSFWNNMLSSDFTYGYIDANLVKSANPNVKYIIGIPKHKLSARLKYSPTEKINIIPSVHYESKRYVDNTVNNPTTRPFVLMNLKVSYNISNNFELSAGINNIFDKYYYYTEGYPEAGRNYYANVDYTF